MPIESWIPIQEDAEDWTQTGAVNIQMQATEPPRATAVDLNLWLICVQCKAYKPFTVTSAVELLLRRKTEMIAYGSRCEKCGHIGKMVLRWQARERLAERDRVSFAGIRDRGSLSYD